MSEQTMELRNFTNTMYQEMIDDKIRTEAYAHALQEVLNAGDVVVDIGTGPFAILARQAARAGAGRIFAIEGNQDVARAGQKFLNKSSDPLCAKIELVEGLSSNVALPLVPDIFVHELLGEIAGREGAAMILRESVARHAPRSPKVAAGTWSVPARARSWLVPAETPTTEQLIAMDSPTGYARRRKHPKKDLLTSYENFPFQDCALATPQCFEVLDFARVGLDPTALTGNHRRRLTFMCDRSGILGGLAIFISVEMTLHAIAEADTAEIQDSASWLYFSLDARVPGFGFSSAWKGSSWTNPFVRLNLVRDSAMRVNRGDIIEVDSSVDLTPFAPKYTLQATLRRRQGEEVTDEVIIEGAFE